MKIGEFFRHPSIQLPTQWKGDSCFTEFMAQLLADYRDLLCQISEPEAVTSRIRTELPKVDTLREKILSAIDRMFAGQPSSAYAELAIGLDLFDKPTMEMLVVKWTGNDLGNLYRVRKQIGRSLSREDLFHIPFEKRYRVSAQRYSIPGLPCLYLCGSVYTCWVEMGEPPFNELQAAAFWMDKQQAIKIVNMWWRPAALQLRLTAEGDLKNPGDEGLFLQQALLWPLFAACSVKVREPTEPFKPEYIIPQLLLQWVAKQPDFDGICYFSTHVDSVCQHPGHSSNFVFPARKSKAKGRCPHLRELFRMSQPHSWQLLRSINAGLDGGSFGTPVYQFAFIPGVEEMYAYTEFGIVQQRLNKLVSEIQKEVENGNSSMGRVEE